MGRMVEKVFPVALILLLAAAEVRAQRPARPAAVEPAGGNPASSSGAPGKGPVRLEEITITGSPEHPGVLFFLPRARFHLLPLRDAEDAQNPVPGTSPGDEGTAR